MNTFKSNIRIRLVKTEMKSVIDAHRQGRQRYYKKLAVGLMINFSYIVSSLLFRYIPDAPDGLHFFGYWCAYLLLAYGVYIQFDFFAAILILAQFDVRHLVPRFQWIWFVIYFVLTFPTYFLLGTLGQEPYPWVKKTWVYSKMAFGCCCALYDLAQGMTSIILLHRHLKSKFTTQGKTFLDNYEKSKTLLRYTLITYGFTLSALAIDVYLSFNYSTSVQKLAILEVELISVIAMLYYFQMLRVASIVLKPRKTKAQPIPIHAVRTVETMDMQTTVVQTR